MSARVVHFEVPYEDVDRARDFYREVFGWEIRSAPGMSYHLVSTGPTRDDGTPTEPGYIGGGMMPRQEAVRSPVIVLDVADIDSALEAVGKHGGSTTIGKMPVGDMGFSAYFTDSEGNLVGLWQNAT